MLPLTAVLLNEDIGLASADTPVSKGIMQVVAVNMVL